MSLFQRTKRPPLSKTRGKPAKHEGIQGALAPLVLGAMAPAYLLASKKLPPVGWAAVKASRSGPGKALKELVTGAAKAAHKHSPRLRRSRTVIFPRLRQQPATTVGEAIDMMFGRDKRPPMTDVTGFFTQYGHAANQASLGIRGPRGRRAYNFVTGQGPTPKFYEDFKQRGELNLPTDPGYPEHIGQVLKYGGLITLPAIGASAATFRSKRLSDKRKKQIYKGLVVGGLGLAGLAGGLGTVAALRGRRIMKLSRPSVLRSAKNPQNLPGMRVGGQETINEIKQIYAPGNKPSLLTPWTAAPVLAGIGAAESARRYRTDLREQRRPLRPKEFLKRGFYNPEAMADIHKRIAMAGY